jgi:uncharacterized protein (TIGR03000 family)
MGVLPALYGADPWASAGVIVPIYATSDAPRMRTALWPAVAVKPGSDVTEASLRTNGTATARIEVRVPVAAAEVWFQDVKTQQTGLVRQFVSPQLNAGSTYSYEIRASWRSGSQPQTETRTLRVEAGGYYTIDFSAPGKD